MTLGNDLWGGTNFLPISGVLACGEPQNVETLMRRGGTAVAVSWRSSMTRDSMMSDRGSSFGFAPTHDAPIPYLYRIRTYYEALGYGAPYEWAHYGSVPFHALAKPLSSCRLTIITTAAPYQPDKGDQGPGAPYNAAAKFYSIYSGDTAQDHDLRISHIAIDRNHTTAEDLYAYFPLTSRSFATVSTSLSPRPEQFKTILGLPSS